MIEGNVEHNFLVWVRGVAVVHVNCTGIGFAGACAVRLFCLFRCSVVYTMRPMHAHADVVCEGNSIGVCEEWCSVQLSAGGAVRSASHATEASTFTSLLSMLWLSMFGESHTPISTVFCRPNEQYQVCLDSGVFVLL